jgi:membrane protein YdbS with pleckstrin-like domain
MNDPIYGLLVVAVVILVLAVVATLFIGHQRRKYQALAEAEREAGRHPAS